MKRYGAVIELHPDKIADYKRLHAAVWPGVLKTITDCNIRNYSIFLRQFPHGAWVLFSY
ncbi:MAG: L-rhamnose mutarotase, partial [FCB group bacterium]|nr:L-rhamnose mutarotase [FCB group bacterium]